MKKPGLAYFFTEDFFNTYHLNLNIGSLHCDHVPPSEGHKE